MTDPQIEEQIRRVAAWALGRIGDPRAAPLLHQEMTDPQVELRDRYLAAEALGNTGDVRAVDLLLEALTDAKIKTQLPGWFPYVTVWTLGKIDDDRSVQALVQAMTDPHVDEGTRASAASALVGSTVPRLQMRYSRRSQTDNSRHKFALTRQRRYAKPAVTARSRH